MQRERSIRVDAATDDLGACQPIWADASIRLEKSMKTAETVKSLAQLAMVVSMANDSNPITSSESTSLFVTQQLMDDLSSSERNVIAIESPVVPDLIAQFRQFAMRSGLPIYLWAAETGIVSLREMDFVVPGSQRLVDALRHVASTLHLGIYLFVGASKDLRPPASGVVRQIARPGAAVEGRKLVFLDKKVRLSEGLDTMVYRIVHDISLRRPPRLRDGRWVV